MRPVTLNLSFPSASADSLADSFPRRLSPVSSLSLKSAVSVFAVILASCFFRSNFILPTSVPILPAAVRFLSLPLAVPVTSMSPNLCIMSGASFFVTA